MITLEAFERLNAARARVMVVTAVWLQRKEHERKDREGHERELSDDEASQLADSLRIIADCIAVAEQKG